MRLEFLAGSEKRFFDFISNLNEKDKIALISHVDADGITSAVLTSKILGKIDYLKFETYRGDLFQDLEKELKQRKITKTIIIDISIDENVEGIKKLEKISEILILDHHPFVKDLNSSRTCMIKVPSEFPAAYLCYYLFSKIQELPEWIAALGVLADRPNIYNAKEAVNVFRDYNLVGKENLYGLSLKLQYAIVYLRDDLKVIYDLLVNAESSGDLKLESYSKIIEDEITRLAKNYEKQKEVHNNLMIFLFESQYSIKAMLINKISCENPGDFVFIYKKKNSFEVSSRTKEVDGDKLMRDSVSGIPDSMGGGHFHAAGASFPAAYLAKFKENLLRAYKELR